MTTMTSSKLADANKGLPKEVADRVEVEATAAAARQARVAPAEPITSLEYVRKPGSLEELLLRENSKVRFVVTTPEGAAKDSFVDCLRILESRDKLGYLFLDEGHLIAES